VFRPTEPGLVARKIGFFGFGLYGAPSYIKETPPHALAFIAYDASMENAPQQRWLKSIAGEREIVLRTGDLENQAAAARAGVGLAALPHFIGQGDPHLMGYDAKAGQVGRDVCLVVHRDVRRAPAVRAVMEFLERCLKLPK
jgi:DNA-binding transcriptional LysR family regulator